MERGLRAAHAAGARLAVLPEMWPTSFVATATEELVAASLAAEARMVALSGEFGMLVVGGGIGGSPGKLENRAVVADCGQVLGVFRKIHTFSPHGEQRTMRGGEEALVLDTRCGRIGVLVCYDLRFPELVRWYFDQGAELLVVPAQWPEARAQHWRTLTRARAIENQCFVVGCNRTGTDVSLKTGEPLTFPGDSQIIDPMGEVLAAGTGEAAPVLAEIDLRKVRTMRKVLPIAKDRRPEVYKRLWGAPLQNPPLKRTSGADPASRDAAGAPEPPSATGERARP